MKYEDVTTIVCKCKDKNCVCDLKFFDAHTREEKHIATLDKVKTVQAPTKRGILVSNGNVEVNLNSYKTFNCDVMELEDKSKLLFCGLDKFEKRR